MIDEGLFCWLYLCCCTLLLNFSCSAEWVIFRIILARFFDKISSFLLALKLMANYSRFKIAGTYSLFANAIENKFDYTFWVRFLNHYLNLQRIKKKWLLTVWLLSIHDQVAISQLYFFVTFLFHLVFYLSYFVDFSIPQFLL